VEMRGQPEQPREGRARGAAAAAAAGPAGCDLEEGPGVAGLGADTAPLAPPGSTPVKLVKFLG